MKPATDRKGYIVVEASIVLPLFILAVLALGYYIKMFGIMENVAYSMMEETAKVASRAYVSEVAPLFESKLEKRITAESPELSDLEITRVRYLYSDGDMDDLIYVNAEYSISNGLPAGFGHTAEISSRIKCRGFTGVRKTAMPMSFEEMETEGVWDPVWIFPADGEKYHDGQCSYVKANAREMVLTGELKKRFSPCSQCGAEDAAAGSYVYCFMENGTVYHTEDCRQVTRYTTEINRSEAIDKGYAPCSKCGGG